MGYVYKFINGPSRTRTFEWAITAAVSGGCVLHGACSALGYGVEFTITADGSGNLFLHYNDTAYALTDGNGTFSVSVPTEERTDGRMFAGPFTASVVEVARVGETASAVFSIGGQSFDVGGIITLPNGCSPNITAYARVGFANDFFAGNGSGSLDIDEPGSMPFVVEEGPASYSGSGAGTSHDPATGIEYTWSWSSTETASWGAHAAGTFSLQRTAPGSPVDADILPYHGYWADGSTWKSGAYAESQSLADRSATLSALLQALDAPSTLEATYKILTTGETVDFTGSGSSAFSFRYRRRWAGGQVYSKLGSTGYTATNHKSETAPLAVQWKPKGYDDTAYQYLGLRLWRWDAMSLTHDASVLVDDGSTLTPSGDWSGVWSAGGGGSVSVASGAVHLTGSAGKTLSRTFTTTHTYDVSGRMQGYCRLRIKLKCSAASHTIRVSILDHAGGIYDPSTHSYVTKQWFVTTGAAGAYTDLYIDLSAEHNGAPIGRADSRWDSYGGTEVAGAHFLNVRAISLSLLDLGAGDYDIDLIELDDGIASTGVADTPKLHAMQMSVGTGAWRLLVATCGGAQTLEVVGDPGYGIITAINALELPTVSASDHGSFSLPGWVAADLDPVAGGTTTTTPDTGPPVITFDDYDDRTCSFLPLLWLSGGGLMYDGTDWQHTFDDGAITMSGSPLTANIEGQWVVASLLWDWPEALESLPGWDGAIGAGALHGGGVWGRMLQLPTIGPTAYRAAIGGNAALSGGTGTPSTDTDAINADTGFYYLVSAGSAGIVPPVPTSLGATSTGTITADGSSQDPKPTASVTVGLGRRRLVLVEDSSAGGEGISLARSFTGRLIRAWADGNIFVEVRSHAGGSWGKTDTGIAGSQPCVRWDTVGKDGKLLMAFEDSGAVKFRTSEDEGGTWSVATTIDASGSHPALCIGQSGVRYFVWYDGGGVIKLRAYDSTQTQVIAARTIVASGAADDSMGIVELMGGKLLLVYNNVSGAVVSVESSDGGLTFA